MCSEHCTSYLIQLRSCIQLPGVQGCWHNPAEWLRISVIDDDHTHTKAALGPLYVARYQPNVAQMGTLPAAVAVDRPLKLGSTFLGTGGEEGYYNLKLDFQPESLQQAQQADLLLLGQDKVRDAAVVSYLADPSILTYSSRIDGLTGGVDD